MMPIGTSASVSLVPGTLSDNLCLAAGRGDVNSVKELLAAGAGLEPDREQRNALHYAAQEGHSDVCKYLAAHGCNINLKDVIGCTPLLKATSQGSKDTVQILLDAGCHIDVQDEHGNAAIHEACWNGFSQTAELLVKYNCNVCLVNKAGFTALHLAAQNGHNECSRVLLYAGCNPDIKNNYGDTALHTAARYGHAGVARILISARCKISEQNKNGDTALHIAAALKRRKIAKILVESGIDTELDNKQHEKAIDVARRKEYPEILLIITSYSKPKPPTCHRFNDEQVGATFKDPVTSDKRLEFCQEDESLHKHEPKADKQQKERRFFFFKKKKNKEKADTVAVGGCKKPDGGHEKPAVQGFFSHYVPRDGVQFYRDLAGNIKQGPIGYAPVCQCGPSLKRLENNITDTRESLQKRISASHHILSQRIDNLDIRTNQQAHATEVLINDRLQNEKDACYARITERLQEERKESQTRFKEANENMKEDLDYWLNDRLASYGHCLDHHHDDSALPPRNLFFDFPATGRLIRSRSDETLSASDYSGKFRKKDFYASRQAAMQHIRGWDVPAFESFSNLDRSRHRERNNNVIANNKVITHALVHAAENIHNPDKNMMQSPENLAAQNNTEKTGTMGTEGNLPWKQIFVKTPQKDYINKGSFRVTFSMDQQKQHLEQSQHQFHSSSLSQNNPHNRVDQVNRSRQNFRRSTPVFSPASQNMGQHTVSAVQHSNWIQQNLPKGGPPNTDVKPNELGDSRKLLLIGQDKLHINRNPWAQSYNHKSTHCESKYDARTLSTESLLNNDNSLSKNIVRCQSVENALADNLKNGTVYNSGYLTDTAVRQCSAGSNLRVTDSQSLHSASTSLHSTHRYRLPETSVSHEDTLFGLHGASIVNSPQQNSISFRQAIDQGQSPTYFSKFNEMVDPDKKRMAPPKCNHALREFVKPTSQPKSMSNLDNNTGRSESEKLNQVACREKYDFMSKSDRTFELSKAHTAHLSSPENNCLQHDNLVNSGSITSAAYALGNKEDSTCSSNQDSGYHGQALKRGIDTSCGTPSSSFSAERSGCNTPSNAELPYITHSEFSSDKIRMLTNSYHSSTSGFQLSSAVETNKNINSHSDVSRTHVPYAGKYNSDMLYVNSNSKVLLPGNMTSGDVINKGIDGAQQGSSSFYDRESFMPPSLMSHKPAVSNRYSHVGCDSSMHLSVDKLLVSNTFQDSGEKSASQRSRNYMDTSERLTFQQNAQNNYLFSYKEDQEMKPLKILNEQEHRYELPCSDDTSFLKQVQLTQNTTETDNNSGHNKSDGRANSQQQTSDSISQVAIQAHIQGWYQRKLMEAADRLKQNQSCSQRNSEQYVPRNDTNYFQRQNVVNGKHDFRFHPSNITHGITLQTFSPTNNFKTLSSTQNIHLHQFQNHATKISYTEHQNSDSGRITGQADVSPHTDLYPRVSLNERNFISSINASQVPPADQSYHTKTGDASIPVKQAVIYSSVFYDSVRGSDV